MYNIILQIIHENETLSNHKKKYYPLVYNNVIVIEANNKSVGSFNGHGLSLDVNVSYCFL